MKRFKIFMVLIFASLTAQAGEIQTYDMNAVTLTRFAIQSLYAPTRLLVTPEGIYRTPMETEKHVPLFYGASIDAMPIASWRSGALYVTAVELKNLTTHPVTIKLDQILGNWQTAAVYPSNTLKARDAHATTSVFLVSDAPFAKALTQPQGFVR